MTSASGSNATSRTAVTPSDALAAAAPAPTPMTADTEPGTTRGALLVSMLTGVLVGVTCAGFSLSHRSDATRSLADAIVALPSDERAAVVTSLEALEDKSFRERYETLFAQLQDDQRDRRLAETYAQWERSRLPELRQSLAALPPKERIARIEEELDEQRKRAVSERPEPPRFGEWAVEGERFDRLAYLVAREAGVDEAAIGELRDEDSFLVMMKAIDAVIESSPEGANDVFDSIRRGIGDDAARRIVEAIAEAEDMPPGIARFMLGAGGPDGEMIRASFVAMVLLNSTLRAAEPFSRQRQVGEEELRSMLAELDGVDKGRLMQLAPPEFEQALHFIRLREKFLRPRGIEVSYIDLRRARDAARDAARDRMAGARFDGRRGGFGRGDGDRPGPPPRGPEQPGRFRPGLRNNR